MKRAMRILGLTTVMTLGVGWPAGVLAEAATPPDVSHMKFDQYFSFEQCGFSMTSHVVADLIFKTTVNPDGSNSYQSEGHAVQTQTNVANGKVVYVSNEGRDAWSDDGVTNPDGTITYTDTLTGQDTRVYTSHSNVLLRDVGLLSIVDTVDADGNLVNEQLVEHGPHQFAGDFDAYCNAIAAAVG